MKKLRKYCLVVASVVVLNLTFVHTGMGDNWDREKMDEVKNELVNEIRNAATRVAQADQNRDQAFINYLRTGTLFMDKVRIAEVEQEDRILVFKGNAKPIPINEYLQEMHPLQKHKIWSINILSDKQGQCMQILYEKMPEKSKKK